MSVLIGLKASDLLGRFQWCCTGTKWISQEALRQQWLSGRLRHGTHPSSKVCNSETEDQWSGDSTPFHSTSLHIPALSSSGPIQLKWSGVEWSGVEWSGG